MMLPKLALGNVKKSIRDYSVYFITMAFAVCIFYIFNSIESQQAMMQTSEGQQMALKLLGKFMDVFSVFISAALCFLIIYANGFLIRRRKKEFGIYLILGMEKGAISRILVMETVLVSTAGLIAGLLMGVLVSQGMALITARLLNSTISTYHFVFSASAAGKTVVYFGLTFLLTLVFNIVTIGRQKLIDLLNSARKSEQFTPPRFARSVVLFVFALVFLGIAYYLTTLDSFFNNTLVFITGVVLLVAGTFLFFFSLSGFFLKLIQNRKQLYLRGLNIFVLRQISSRIHTNYVSMTFVCLMLMLAICALSSGTGIANSISAQQEGNAPFDATVVFQQEVGDEERSLVPHVEPNIEAMLREQNVDLAAIAGKWSTFSLYQSPVVLTLSDIEGNPVEIKTQVMRLSDYNALRATRGEEPVVLGPDSFVLHANLPGEQWAHAVGTYLEGQPTVDFNGTTLTAASTSLYTDMLQTMTTRVEEVELIVPDEYVVKDGRPVLPVLRTFLNIDYREHAGSADALDKSLTSEFVGFVATGSDGIDLGALAVTRTEVLQVGSSATTIVAYIALYLGMVFLLASAALLAIAQLSEASDNVSRYRLLAKLGTEDKMLRGALLGQIAIYFGVPMLLALVHSLVGIVALCSIFAALKDTDILNGSLVTALVLIAVYGGYFLATYIGSKSILNREVIHRLAQR
ncbi:MAG: ABC transporter permease [Coriobacteriales bacterium]|jgi:putative ABC transport system permease protein|nr:ABC transporter permease [Coriobacteriales bacterium]